MSELSPEEREGRIRWFESYTETVRSKRVNTVDAGPAPCPCCGHLTLQGRGSYEVCPVCFWEDDGQDDPHADEVWGGPNGSLSLTAARENYRRIGAVDEASLPRVRPPRPEESPSL